MIRILRLAVILSVVMIAPAFAVENLVMNASLEDPLGPNDEPDGWHFFREEKGQYEHKVVPGGHSGEKCYKISGRGEWAGVGFQQVEYDASRRYVGSGWLKIEGEKAQATVKLDYMDGDQKYLGSTVASQSKGPADWLYVRVVSGAQDFPEAKFVAAVAVITGEGALSIDDVSFFVRPPLESETPTNQLLNGAVEMGAGNSPAMFFTAASEGSHPVLDWSEDQPHSGSRCIYLKGDGQWAVMVHFQVPYDKDKTYTASGWGRVASGAATVKVDYFQGEMWLGELQAAPLNEYRWKQASLTVDPQRFPEFDRIAVAVVLLGQGEAWFDDLMLEAK